jgi:hypothetical protein
LLIPYNTRNYDELLKTGLFLGQRSSVFLQKIRFFDFILRSPAADGVSKRAYASQWFLPGPAAYISLFYLEGGRNGNEDRISLNTECAGHAGYG